MSGGPRQSLARPEEGGSLGEAVDRRERSQGQPGRREPSSSYCRVLLIVYQRRAETLRSSDTGCQLGEGLRMIWFWLNMPLAAAFFAAWVGIPLWLVVKHPGHAAKPATVQAAAGPADVPAMVAPQSAMELAGV